LLAGVFETIVTGGGGQYDSGTKKLYKSMC